MSTTAKLSENSRIKSHSLILLPFLTVAQHEKATRKTISWSVTVYNKNLFSQCNLTAQIEPVQDKYYSH